MTITFCGLALAKIKDGSSGDPVRELPKPQQDDLIRDFMFWQDAGLRPLPLVLGKKFPGEGWRHAESPTVDVFGEQVRDHQTHGIGVPLGESDVVIDVEGRFRHTLPEVMEAAARSGDLPLLQRVVAGLTEETPTGGLHIHARLLDGQSRREVLARRPRDGGSDVLVEVLGLGQQVVVAPSGGLTHATGRPYRRLCGSPTDIVAVTSRELERLLSLFRGFDEMPSPLSSFVSRNRGGESIIERDFNARATWEEILERWGWRKAGRERQGRIHGIQAWTRPGKTSGLSATTCGDVMCVFSTAAGLPLFEPPAAQDGWGQHSLTKFDVFALLNHDGDREVAARAAWKLGYGKSPSPRPLRPGIDARSDVAFLAECLGSAIKNGPQDKRAVCDVAAAVVREEVLLKVVNRELHAVGKQPIKTFGRSHGRYRTWACEKVSRQAIANLVHAGQAQFNEKTWVLRGRKESSHA